jgi:hypothetical protein
MELEDLKVVRTQKQQITKNRKIIATLVTCLIIGVFVAVSLMRQTQPTETTQSSDPDKESLDHVFDLESGTLAIGDPAMGLARYPLRLAPGAYRLGSQAFQLNAGDNEPAPLISLDSPCVYALDAAHLAKFKEWYHRVGNECNYMALTLAERLPEFESAVGARVGFYWEREVAGDDREGEYVLDPAGVFKLTE